MLNKPINVVGAGLAGSLVARVLRSHGFEVRVIDDMDQFSASQASSNLYINHWLKKFSAAQAKRGVRVLERLFHDKIEEPFANGLGYAAQVKHIPQRAVLVEPDVTGKVVEVTDVGCMVDGVGFANGATVLCTGYRASELVDLDVDIKVGHCFLVRGRLPKGKSRIAMISPYKHEKLYQFDENHIYYADSVGLKLSAYWKRQEELKARTLERLRRHVPDAEVVDFRVGYRPLTPGYDFGLLSRHSDWVWSVNGGGKNGLVAYAALAEQLVEALEKP